MKRFSVILLAILLGTVSTIFISCTKEQKTPGMLTIQVIGPNFTPVPWEKVYLATSLENLRQHSYLQEAMTSENGYAKFDTLTPGVYWFDTEHWEDYGAVEVYFNIDFHTILYVNTPSGIQK